MTGCLDGVVLGTGHNAFVLQAYLCRTVLRVLPVDRAETPGRRLATVENLRHPGSRYNTHSFSHQADWIELFEPVGKLLLMPEASSPPLPPELRCEWLEREEVLSALNPQSGCVFVTRCTAAVNDCHAIIPELRN